MKSIFNVLAIFLLLVSCTSDDEVGTPEEENNQINIRIYNSSAFELKDFMYENNQTFSSIMAGETTEYMRLESSYDTPGSYSLTIQEEQIALFTIDFLGNSKLEPGFYTYYFYAYQYDDGQFITGGRILLSEDVPDFDTMNADCMEIETTECETQPSKVNIKVRNTTAFDLCNLEVDFNDQNQATYGSFESGEESCYFTTTFAKRIPLLCKFSIGDEEFRIENPGYYENLDNLAFGSYTYNIALIEPINRIAIIQLSNN